MSDIHPLSGSSYDHLAQSNPMDVNNHPDNILPDAVIADMYANASGTNSNYGLNGDASTLGRTMGTSTGKFISSIQKDDSLSITKKFRK